MEVEPDPEHEQDHPDLGELAGDLPVGDEPRGVRADDDPRQEIPDDRGEPDPVGHVPEGEGGCEPAGQRQDQLEVVHDSRARCSTG